MPTGGFIAYYRVSTKRQGDSGLGLEAQRQALAAARLRRVPVVVANVSRLTRSVAFLTRLLEAGVDVRFADLPQIEGPTGRFMLTQMAAVAELEAGFIGDRTKKALAQAKLRGKKLGGQRRAVVSVSETGRKT